MTDAYYRPLARTGKPRPKGAFVIAGGWAWFTEAERLSRGVTSELLPASEIPAPILGRITAPRPPIAGIGWDQPRLMGILNVTPDSFSDGGLFADTATAVAHATAMAAEGADIIDIGGESTRPGAETVPAEAEITRVRPVIAALAAARIGAPLSIDTRKPAVARAALSAGAALWNDVTALNYDPQSLATAVETGALLCLMHTQGEPQTMQADPRYSDVLLDVYDHLEARVAAAEAAGIPRARIMVDAGIGFGKTQEHNLALLRGLTLFHGLGCPILLGVSRKRFIGTIGNAPQAADRAPGSIAIGLLALEQGVQMLRAHDICATKQALLLWQALRQVPDQPA